MSIIIKYRFFVLFLAVFISSCSGSLRAPAEGMPDIGVPLENINRDMKITNPEGWNNSFKNGQGLSFIVDIISKRAVQMPIDYGTRVFIYQNKQWVEIQDRMEYPTGVHEETILDPSKKGPIPIPYEGSFSVMPYQSGLNETVPMRIVIIGIIVQNGKATDEKTAAYYDHMLKP